MRTSDIFINSVIKKNPKKKQKYFVFTEAEKIILNAYKNNPSSPELILPAQIILANHVGQKFESTVNDYFGKAFKRFFKGGGTR